MEPLTRRPSLREARFTTDSPEETQKLGELLGRVLKPQDFVGLIGELGAGKTRFVRGVAQGAEVPPSEVASPTFAIVYPYRGRILLHHADLYRLADPDELYATGFFDLGAESALLVEWVDKVPQSVPDDALLIELTAPELEQESLRTIHARATGPRSVALLGRWVALRPP